nr:hypothetical protein [Tanacetum cinerariifolium]
MRLLESTRFEVLNRDLLVLDCSSSGNLLTPLAGEILFFLVLLLGCDPLALTKMESLKSWIPNFGWDPVGKLQPKADIGIFIGYAPTKKAFRIYNRHTKRIIETIHVNFDELTAMASEQSNSGPTLHEMTHATISSGLVPKLTSSTSLVPSLRTD